MVEVSVVVPVRNREQLLPATLESVLAQEFEDWECIIVDDGSTDGTPEVIERYVACDRRFRAERTSVGSAAAARNQGMRVASGRYLAFLDSDDLFTPDRLAWQAELLRADDDLVLVYGDTLRFDARSGTSKLHLEHGERPQGPYAFESLLASSAILSPLVRRSTLRGAGGFDVHLPSAENWDAWLKLSQVGGVAFRPRVALRYRLHAGNESSDLLRDLRCAQRVLEKHLPVVPMQRRARVRRAAEADFRARYGPQLLQAACRSTRAGDWDEARPLWRAVAWLEPHRLRTRHVLLHTLWSCLPTRGAPDWAEWLRSSHDEGARSGS